ncbi:MAG: threonine aldolase [Tannerellaceae bacterium]|jgi:threonine aldolase|nr:threonine aldolase [Tannerellaceae bacterium]
MRSFASDNNSGVHPQVMEAIISANVGHAVGYGDDSWTKLAVGLLEETFGGASAEAFIVFNGTGANSVALQAVTQSFNSILCSTTAHIFVDECGAPVRMSGCMAIPIPTTNGKLTTDQVLPYLKNYDVCHHSQPAVLYISQVTELGTVYTVEEIKSLADLLHWHGMYLHMDCARIANACAKLKVSPADLTVKAGADIISFGGTKNGMMMGEAVISFRPKISANLKYYRKQSAQLASKMRYLSAQFIPYLTNDLWLRNAANANAKAARLAAVLKDLPGISFTQETETNQLFFTMPREAAQRLAERYFFYYWNEDEAEVRLVTSWDTTDEDVDELADYMRELLLPA